MSQGGKLLHFEVNITRLRDDLSFDFFIHNICLEGDRNSRKSPYFKKNIFRNTWCGEPRDSGIYEKIARD